MLDNTTSTVKPPKPKGAAAHPIATAGLQTVTTKVPPSLWRELRLLSVERQSDIRKELAAAIEQYVRERRRKR